MARSNFYIKALLWMLYKEPMATSLDNRLGGERGQLLQQIKWGILWIEQIGWGRLGI